MAEKSIRIYRSLGGTHFDAVASPEGHVEVSNAVKLLRKQAPGLHRDLVNIMYEILSLTSNIPANIQDIKAEGFRMISPLLKFHIVLQYEIGKFEFCLQHDGGFLVSDSVSQLYQKDRVLHKKMIDLIYQLILPLEKIDMAWNLGGDDYED